jgi:hypothetical protein
MTSPCEQAATNHPDRRSIFTSGPSTLSTLFISTDTLCYVLSSRSTCPCERVTLAFLRSSTTSGRPSGRATLATLFGPVCARFRWDGHGPSLLATNRLSTPCCVLNAAFVEPIMMENNNSCRMLGRRRVLLTMHPCSPHMSITPISSGGPFRMSPTASRRSPPSSRGAGSSSGSRTPAAITWSRSASGSAGLSGPSHQSLTAPGVCSLPLGSFWNSSDPQARS